MYVEELKDNKEWETFLQTSPEGTFFHSLEWKNLIEKSFPHSPLYLTVRDANGTLVAICPGFILNSLRMKIYCSTPYSDYGGPVIAGHCIEEASLSLRSFLQNSCSTKGIAYAKICFANDKLWRFFDSPLGYLDANKGIVEIDLKDTPSDSIWKKVFSKNRRWKIRSIERGFQIDEVRTKSDLRDFYNLYYKNMKYISASPYPYEFFENMWNILYPEHLRIWLVEKKKRIAGIAVFKHKRKTYWAYAGIDRKQCKHTSVVPYLVWKEIEKAEEEGRTRVSLGSTPSDPRNPYYLQKMGFGGSFLQQQMVWYPFSPSGRVLLQTRAKATSAWKTIRNLLPANVKRPLESKLSKF